MKLLLLDANSLINRAFYAIRPLSTKNGEYTNAIYGFLTTYWRIVEEEHPDAVCACFDLKAPTFRHMEYEGYKAGRRPTPPELISQIELLKEVLDTMGITRLELPGFEADDLLGTMSLMCEQDDDWEAVVVTGDRDSLQLVGEETRVSLITTKAGHPVTTQYTPELIAETFGVTPAQLIEVKALQGDTSDNIPGVPGIGEKSALTLIQRFGTVEKLYEELETSDLRDTMKKKLWDGHDSAVMSRRLAEIDRRAPVALHPADAMLKAPDEDALYRLFLRLELKKFIVQLGLHAPAEKPAAIPAQEVPLPFGEPAEVTLVRADAALLQGWVPSGRVAFQVYGEREVIAVRTASQAFYVCAGDLTEESLAAFWNKLMAAGLERISCDIKPVYLSMLTRGEELPDVPVEDMAIAAYVLDPTAGEYTVPSIALRYLEKDVQAPDYELFASPLADCADEERKLASCLETLWAMKNALDERLRQQGCETFYRETELPLCAVLARMQHAGCAVDARQLAAYSAELGEKIRALEEGIVADTGVSCNLNSPKQLGELLFEKLGLPGGKKTKTGYSTDIDTLNYLKPFHPCVEKIIAYRQLTKLKGTYTDGLVRFIEDDGRIHSHFQQLVTATGRLSSTDPNMQNIPVRRAVGAELRRMFVAPEGCVLIDADYSQIELRLLAHVAQDRAMIEGFAAGADIHRLTAASVQGIAPDEVTPAQRSAAKAVNFGIVYGISAFSLSGDLGISVAEAKRYIENYLNAYPGVKVYMERIKKEAAADGYVTTLYGRRRDLPELKSSNRNMRAFGERVALNTPIQGSAADIIKRAMVAVDARLRREGMKARLILQVHDELIVEAPREEAETVARLLTEEMENAADLSVKLVAEASMGEDWYNAKG